LGVQAARLAPSDIPVRETPPTQPLEGGVEPNFSGNINQVTNPDVLEEPGKNVQTSQPNPEEQFQPKPVSSESQEEGEQKNTIWILLAVLVVVALGYGLYLKQRNRPGL
jgi:hypothetical protein